jgi:hypothetical protein
VVSAAKKEPDDKPAVWTVTEPGQLSEPVTAAHETSAPQSPASLLTLIFDGQEMDGFSVSFTVTVNEQSFVKPAASVALRVTVVEPTGNALPLESPDSNPIEDPGQLSDAEPE